MFQAYPSIGNRPPLGVDDGGHPWVAVPKLHGSNMQFDVVVPAADAGAGAGAVEIRAGRRNGYLGRTNDGVLTNPSEDDHFGSKSAVLADGIEAKLQQLRESLGAPPRFIAYCEVYGGQYGPQAGVGQTRKPVQKHVWYAHSIRLAFFDLWVEGRGFLPFDEAQPLFEAAGLPFVPAAFRGTYEEVHAWARTHAADNATAFYNPEGLPPLDNNAGEGFVIRPATVELEARQGERVLFKIKNPAFQEIAVGKDKDKDKGSSDTSKPVRGCACMEGARRILGAKAMCPARVAAVFSKQAEADLTVENMGALVQKVLDDVRVSVLEEGWQWPVEHEGKCGAVAALRTAAWKEVSLALREE